MPAATMTRSAYSIPAGVREPCHESSSPSTICIRSRATPDRLASSSACDGLNGNGSVESRTTSVSEAPSSSGVTTGYRSAARREDILAAGVGEQRADERVRVHGHPRLAPDEVRESYWRPPGAARFTRSCLVSMSRAIAFALVARVDRGGDRPHHLRRLERGVWKADVAPNARALERLGVFAPILFLVEQHDVGREVHDAVDLRDSSYRRLSRPRRRDRRGGMQNFVRPTSSSPRPRSKTSSVKDGHKDTIRIRPKLQLVTGARQGIRVEFHRSST